MTILFFLALSTIGLGNESYAPFVSQLKEMLILSW
jgi:hypothetical protein